MPKQGWNRTAQGWFQWETRARPAWNFVIAPRPLKTNHEMRRTDRRGEAGRKTRYRERQRNRGGATGRRRAGQTANLRTPRVDVPAFRPRNGNGFRTRIAIALRSRRGLPAEATGRVASTQSRQSRGSGQVPTVSAIPPTRSCGGAPPAPTGKKVRRSDSVPNDSER